MRLIAVTGYGQGSDAELALKSSIDLQLTKPVHLDDLVSALRGMAEH